MTTVAGARELRAAMLVAAALGVAGCGGGGGGGDAAAPAQAPARSTALADTPAPAGLNLAGFEATRPVRSTDLVPNPARFADPARTYVSLFINGDDGSRQQLAFLRLSALQALDARGGLVLDRPRDRTTVAYEVYDAGGASTALSGEIRP